MSKRKPRKKAAEMSSDMQDVPEESTESDSSDETAPEAPPEPPPTAKQTAPRKAKKDSKVVPIQKAMITCERFVRRKGELGDVFAQVTRMANKGKVQKRTVEEWTKLYDVWLKAPRG